MTLAQRRNRRLTTHFSERIPVVKRRISVLYHKFKPQWYICLFVGASFRPQRTRLPLGRIFMKFDIWGGRHFHEIRYMGWHAFSWNSMYGVGCIFMKFDICGGTHFHEIRYTSISRKNVQKIQIWLNPDKNNRHFTWTRVHIYENISLNAS